MDEIATKRAKQRMKKHNRKQEAGVRMKEHCCPAAAKMNGKKKSMGNTDYNTQIQAPQASYGDKTPPQNCLWSAGRSMEARPCHHPILSHLTHTLAHPLAHRH